MRATSRQSRRPAVAAMCGYREVGAICLACDPLLPSFSKARSELRPRKFPPKKTSLGVATYFALGNHYLALGQLQDAFDAYRNALLRDPGDSDSKFNLELVLLRMKQTQPPTQGQGQPGPSPNPDQNSNQPG